MILRDFLEKKFPPGTSESVVLEELEKEGFQTGLDDSSHRHCAFYEMTIPCGDGACKTVCLIDWDLNGGHLTGDFHASLSMLSGIGGRPPLP